MFRGLKWEFGQLLDKLFMIATLVLFFKFFYLVSDADSILLKGNSDGRYDVIMLITFIYLVAYAIFDRQFLMGSYGRFVVIFILFILIQYCYTFFSYGQDFSVFSPTKIYYLSVMIYFGYNRAFIRRNNFEFFINAMAVFSIVMCLLLLCQRVYYIATGELFLYNDAVRAGTFVYEIRNFGLRFNAGSGMITFITCFFTAYLTKKNDEKGIFPVIYKIAAILGYIVCLVIFQSRVSIVVLFIVLFFNIWNMEFKNIRIKALFITFVVVLALCFLATNSSVVQKIIGISSSEGSFWARTGALQYFIKKFLDNPVFGIGLVASATPALDELVHGTEGFFYYSDMGMIGNLAELGIFVLIWFVAFLVKLVMQGREYNDYRKMILYNMALTMGLLTFTTLSVFTGEWILMLPLAMGMAQGFLYQQKYSNLD